jgi:hypothetical protein
LVGSAVETGVRERAILERKAGKCRLSRSATVRIKLKCIPLLLVAAAAGVSTGAAPPSAIVGGSGSVAPASPRAAGVPVYSHTEVLIGSAIVLALCLIVLATLAVGWWRAR